MKPIQLISNDVFDKIRSRFQNLEMGDETGAVTIDPMEARFFDFDFINEGVNLGRISISINEPGSLKVYYSQGITEGKDDMAKQIWFGFLREMRYFSQRRLLRFDTKDIAKNNLDKNDFKYLAKKGKKDNSMNESMFNGRSSRKTSRAVKGATEVIVRHHRPVDEMVSGARSRSKNIKAIFIQNRDGERFKYPFIHTAGAFAMAQHIDHGGIPHDPAGKAIVNMSEQIAQLGQFHRHVQRTSLHDDAMSIRDRAYQKLQELKRHIDSIGHRKGYLAWKESHDAMQNMESMDNELAELDAVTVEQYKQKFTQNNFNEELAKFFPLIHSIMSEENEIDLEEYTNTDEDPISENEYSAARDAFEEFEQWAEDVEKGEEPREFNRDERDDSDEPRGEGEELTPDQIGALKAALDSKEKDKTGQPIIDLGDGGEDAWMLFSSENTGITDETDSGRELKDDLEKLNDATNGEGNALDVFIPWVKKYYPDGDILRQLGIEDTSEPQQQLPAPAAPPAVPPAAPAPETPPVAAPAAPAPMAPPAPGQMPAMENTEKQTNPSMMEDKHRAMIKAIAKCVKSLYNEANETVAPFRTKEGVALEVRRTIEEKFGKPAAERAEHLAREFVEHLTRKWEEKFHKKVGDLHPDIDDENNGGEFGRFRHLLSSIKKGVESIGDMNKPVENVISHPGTGGNQRLSAMEELRRLSNLVK